MQIPVVNIYSLPILAPRGDHSYNTYTSILYLRNLAYGLGEHTCFGYTNSGETTTPELVEKCKEALVSMAYYSKQPLDVENDGITFHIRGRVCEIRYMGNPFAFVEASGLAVYVQKVDEDCHRSLTLCNAVKDIALVVACKISREVKDPYFVYPHTTSRGIRANDRTIRMIKGRFIKEHGSELRAFICKGMPEDSFKASYRLQYCSGKRKNNFDRVPVGYRHVKDKYLLKDIIHYYAARAFMINSTSMEFSRECMGMPKVSYKAYIEGWQQALNPLGLKCIRRFLSSNITFPVATIKVLALSAPFHRMCKMYSPEPWRIKYILSAYIHRLGAVDIGGTIGEMNTEVARAICLDTKEAISSHKVLGSGKRTMGNFRTRTRELVVDIPDMLIGLREAGIEIAVPKCTTMFQLFRFSGSIHKIWNETEHLRFDTEMGKRKANFHGMDLSLPYCQPPAPFVLLKSGLDLIATGSKAKHCLGSSGYWNQGVTGRSYFVHLPGEDGGATAEIDLGGSIVQIHGPLNESNKSCIQLKKELSPWLKKISDVYSIHHNKQYRAMHLRVY